MKHRTRRNLAAAQTTLAKTAALGIAAGQVITRRVARAASGDHGEAGRMVTEKIGAAALSGVAGMQHAATMAMRMSGFAVMEAFRLGYAAQAMAAARTVESLWRAQYDFMLAGLPRWQSQSEAIGTDMMRSGSAMLAPVHKVAAANARRLGG